MDCSDSRIARYGLVFFNLRPNFPLDPGAAFRFSQVPVIYLHNHAMDLDPGRAEKYSPLVFAHFPIPLSPYMKKVSLCDYIIFRGSIPSLALWPGYPSLLLRTLTCVKALGVPFYPAGWALDRSDFNRLYTPSFSWRTHNVLFYHKSSK